MDKCRCCLKIKPVRYHTFQDEEISFCDSCWKMGVDPFPLDLQPSDYSVVMEWLLRIGESKENHLHAMSIGRKDKAERRNEMDKCQCCLEAEPTRRFSFEGETVTFCKSCFELGTKHFLLDLRPQDYRAVITFLLRIGESKQNFLRMMFE